MSARIRARIGWRLRCLADRIDHEHSPAVTHWTFTFERGEGIRFREDRKGCPVWYPRAMYDRAHREADSAST